jgi:hypothetical protein
MKINLTFVDGLIDIKIFFNPSTNNTSSNDFSSLVGSIILMVH